jgi:serine/threonine protein kinase
VTEREIFETALDFDGPRERAAYLSDVCSNDETLRGRVESLLRSHEKAADFLNTPVVEQIAGGGEGFDFLSPSQKSGSLGRLGHYEILEVVGRGGMGIVFRAFDTKLNRSVAIKVLAPQLSTSRTARQRFVREAQAAAAVSHEHIVAIHAVEDAGEVPYLVMQFVDGTTLQKKLERTGQLPVSDILRIAVQIADGLSAAHSQGLVHRDIKPANILLETGNERVKITDFGLARAADDVSVTQSGVVAGTPMFMSPEQADGQSVDFRSDQFSLGSVLYVMCTGQPPFRAPSALSILKRVCEESPPPIREINPELPQWLGDLVARLHAKSPTGRFASTQEVAEILGRGLAETKSGGATSGTIVIAPPPSLRTKPKTTASRRLTVTFGVTLALLAGLTLCEGFGITNIRGALGRADSHEAPRPPAPSEAEKIAEWERSVADLPAEEQVKAVAARLVELNPGFSGKVTPTIHGTAVTWLKFSTEKVTNVSPVRALKQLAVLDVAGRIGKLEDLAPLAGMKLTALICDHTKVSDLSPLQGMSLTFLKCSGTDVSNLKPLAGMPIRNLYCACPRVSDLSPLRGMRLERVDLSGTAVSELSPLQGMPTVELNLYAATQVRNITPLKGMPLEILNLGNTKVADLSPLIETTSLRTLVIDQAPVTDLAVLKGTRLESLMMRNTQVTDLAPLKDLPLKHLWIDASTAQKSDILRSLHGLERINDKPVAEFWKTIDK